MGRNILRSEASVAQAEEDYAVIRVTDKLSNMAGKGAWWTLSNVHSAHIFSVGWHEPRVIHEKVGVNKIQIHVVNQGSRVPQVGVIFLKNNPNVFYARLLKIW